jgi:hypothetical protein
VRTADTSTRDGDKALATFAADHKAEEHSNGLRVIAPEGTVVASFGGPGLSVQRTVVGRLQIFRSSPKVVHDSQFGFVPVAQPSLAELNRLHAEFYSRCSKPRDRKANLRPSLADVNERNAEYYRGKS